LIVSAHGGVEIEAVDDQEIDRQHVDPFPGLTAFEKRRVAKVLGLTGGPAKSLDRLLEALWKLFQAEDAELVEINPLAVVGDGLVALDAKVIIEDDAAFRHPEYAEIRDDRTPLEEIAREKDIAFVQLDGNIGVIANGAGLTMATLDVLKELGGNPGVFLDLGGTDDPRKVTEAFLLMARAQPRAVFLNIFGGVTRCDTVATGLVEAMRQVPATERFPLVARIRGNNEKEGIEILRAAGITSIPDLRASAQAVVTAAGGTA
jgi:succinyl-CoA synthetase beta subunit